MNTLILRHVKDSDPTSFLVVRQSDGAASEPCAVPSPVGYPVEGRPNSDLLQDLRWYLEQFLELPTDPYRELAGRIVAARDAWGTELFEALFDGDRKARRAYDQATADGFGNLRLRVISDDPAVLGWSWEALRDPEAGILAHECAIERRLESDVRDPLPLPDALPRDRINILLVTARPFERDVGFRSVSLPLVELIEKQNLPARVTLLRPPTLEALDRHLEEHAGHYHLLHFDGHGSYEPDPARIRAAVLEGEQHKLRAAASSVGRLVFERESDDAEGRAEPVTGADLANLLRKHRLPAVVLNACQSAMIDQSADDPFASVAAALIKAGVRDVVAMSHSLWVSAARELLPAFYEALFRNGDFGAAVSAGRRRLLIQKNRLGGGIAPEPLEDWHIPVHYRNDPEETRLFDFANPSETTEDHDVESSLPPEAADRENPYGLIGRDRAIQVLEKHLRARPAGILIQGMGGVGKTTLAKGFLRWLAQTGGIEGAIWFTFDEGRRTAESVINEIGMALFGTAFGAWDLEKRFQALATLRTRRLVIVWDNFEVVQGVLGGNRPPAISRDASLCRRLLQILRGGETKVMITSRSDEDWLGAENRRKLTIVGLHGEERSELCRAVLRDLDIRPKGDQHLLTQFLDDIEGHPLIMRILLPMLKEHSPTELQNRWREKIADSNSQGSDALQQQLHGSLLLVNEQLPEQLRPVLIPLALHESYVNAEYVESMSKEVDAALVRGSIDRALMALVSAGLLDFIENSIYSIHPVLTAWLRASVLSAAEREITESWTRQFVFFMASLATYYEPKPAHEQRAAIIYFGASIHKACIEAKRLGMSANEAELKLALATFAQNQRAWVNAESQFRQLLRIHKKLDNLQGEAIAYNRLGMIAQERRDFVQADRWYKKAVKVNVQIGDTEELAASYHNLGMIAQERRDFEQAVNWYQRSLAISEKRKNTPNMATTYHQLAMVAQERRAFEQAKMWYEKSRSIREMHGDLLGVMMTYHQLSLVYYQCRDFNKAQALCKKSLALNKQLENLHGIAINYQQLGLIAGEHRDFGAAESWYKKSLAIAEQLDDAHGAAIAYHQLGRMALECRDLTQAENWSKKSLAVKQQQGNAQSAATTYHQLGRIAEERNDPDQAESWFKKALVIHEKGNDPRGKAKVYHQLGNVCDCRREVDQAEVWYRKAAAINEHIGDAHSLAINFHQLGRLAQDRLDFCQAENWYKKALAIKEQQNDAHGAASTYGQLGLFEQALGHYRQAGVYLLKALSIFIHQYDRHQVRFTVANFWQLYKQTSEEDRAVLRAMWEEEIDSIEPPPWDQAPPEQRNDDE